MTATHEPNPTARPRQTAGNNVFLKHCRKLFNTPIYKRCLGFVNDPVLTVGQGEDTARAYLQEYVTRTIDF